ITLVMKQNVSSRERIFDDRRLVYKERGLVSSLFLQVGFWLGPPNGFVLVFFYFNKIGGWGVGSQSVADPSPSGLRVGL
ncbi:hypothetical protein PSY31_23960, partial [Shigella flexneri]|nr:hypothetical protein [Shigella flexneri]